MEKGQKIMPEHIAHPVSGGKAVPFFQKTVRNPFFTSTLLQPSLVVGPANDRYEREADRIAMQVMGEDSQVEAVSLMSRIQRMGGSSGMPASPQLTQSIEKERGKGHTLDRGIRSSLEQRMGTDFSGVRVHTGNNADSLNRSIQARAFTTGRDVFFRKGEYQPTSKSGQQLLAHELTHVVQQGGGAQTVQREWTPAPDAKEEEVEYAEWRRQKVEEIKALIAEKLPNRDGNLAEYDEIYANIGAFLEDKTRFLVRLLPLEKALMEAKGESTERLSYTVLNKELTEAEAEYGFNVEKTGDKGPAVIFGTLTPADFLNKLIARGFTWEDPSFNSHGALSHRIQWYAIANEVAEHPELYGNKSVLELYTRIPEYGTYLAGRKSENTFSLWDILVDAVPADDFSRVREGFPGSDSARSPDVVNKSFKKKGGVYPLIAEALKSYIKEVDTDDYGEKDQRTVDFIKELQADTYSREQVTGEQSYIYWRK